MKCIQCGTDNKLRDRTSHQGRCKTCNHSFAFEPTAMGTIRLTDPLFAKALSDVSANNTLYFTPRQLFYLLEKRLNRRTRGNIVVGGGCLLIFLGMLLAATGVGLIVIAIGVVLLIVDWLQPKFSRNKQSRAFVIRQENVDQWLQRWHQVNSSPTKLLPSAPTQAMPVEQSTLSTDITAYSFDRLVVCESAAIAQMLIANNVHFENNCAILSISGYPQRVFATAMEMLRRNQDLRVFALHDCSASGIAMVHQLRTDPRWFAGSEALIIDVGLFPRQILAAKNEMSIQQSEQSAQAAKSLLAHIRQPLSARELQWLDQGNAVSLESFTPQILIQMLQRRIASSQEIQEGDSSLLLIDDGGGYGGSYIYAADSFG